MMNSRSTLVTGADGFIGRQLVARLLQQGYRVTALVHTQKEVEWSHHAHLTIKVGDLTDEKSLAHALKGCVSVFHLASLVAIWHPQPEEFERVNVQGTKHLLDACRDNAVRRVLICSSCGIFGSAQPNQSIDENTPVNSRLWGPYERSKYNQAQLALNYQSPDVEVVVAYPTRVFGPRPSRNASFLTTWMKRIGDGKFCFVPGDGQSVGNYVFVDDVAGAMQLIMESGQNGEGFIVGGNNLTYEQLFREIKQVAGANARLVHVPVGILRLAARLDEIRARLFRSRFKLTSQAVEKYLANWNVSILKIQNELGFVPTPLDRAIEMTLGKKSRTKKSRTDSSRRFSC
jgi:NAD+-dependent farnesol dehydrogenase